MHPIDQMKNTPTEVEVGGRVIAIHEITMAGLPAFSAAVEPFMAAFDEAGDLPAARQDQVLARNTTLFRLLAQHSDAFITAACVVTDADAAFYRSLPPDAFFKVASVIVERNAAFFVQRLAPSLIKFAADISLTGSMLSTHLQTMATQLSKS